MSSQHNSSVSRDEKTSAAAQFFKNPWSETTQKVRNNLLLVSVIGILMGAVGIIPTAITALGVQLGSISPRALLITWALVDAYFTTTFAFYAYSDFLRGYWDEISKQLFGIESMAAHGKFPQDKIAMKPISDMRKELDLAIRKLKRRLQDIHILRLVLDVLIPVLSGVAALVFLLAKSATL